MAAFHGIDWPALQYSTNRTSQRRHTIRIARAQAAMFHLPEVQIQWQQQWRRSRKVAAAIETTMTRQPWWQKRWQVCPISRGPAVAAFAGYLGRLAEWKAVACLFI